MSATGQMKSLIASLCNIPTRERLVAELKGWRNAGALSRTERYCFGQAVKIRKAGA